MGLCRTRGRSSLPAWFGGGSTASDRYRNTVKELLVFPSSGGFFSSPGSKLPLLVFHVIQFSRGWGAAWDICTACLSFQSTLSTKEKENTLESV